MDHRDHVGLIRAGVEGASPRWLELGAGEGAFTLALADLLGPAADILALDRDGSALRHLAADLPARFPGRRLMKVTGDMRDPLPDGPFDGVLAANSLHFLTDPVAVLRHIAAVLRPGGRLVVVEYDADEGNRWVPHPFSSRRFAELAAEAGLRDPLEIGRVPSRFLGAIYAARADRPGPDPVLLARKTRSGSPDVVGGAGSRWVVRTGITGCVLPDGQPSGYHCAIRTIVYTSDTMTTWTSPH